MQVVPRIVALDKVCEISHPLRVFVIHRHTVIYPFRFRLPRAELVKTNERMCELVIQTYAEIHSQSRKVSLAFTDMIIMRGWSVIEQACVTLYVL